MNIKNYYCRSGRRLAVISSPPSLVRIQKYRWHGILIEPQKIEFERLIKNYKNESDNLIFENVAIADHETTRNLYKVKDEQIVGDWQRGIASLIPMEGLEEQNAVTIEAVQCISFDTLLERNKVKKIDLLQIDVEGYDYEILKLVNFERLKPHLIRYEHRHLNLSDKNACKKYLKKLGYTILEMQYDTGAKLS